MSRTVTFESCAPDLSGCGRYFAFIFSQKLHICHAETMALLHVSEPLNEDEENNPRKSASHKSQLKSQIYSIVWDKSPIKVGPNNSQRLAVCLSNGICTFLVSEAECVPSGSLILENYDTAFSAEWLSFDNGTAKLAVCFPECDLQVSIFDDDGLAYTIHSPRSNSALQIKPSLFAYISHATSDSHIMHIIDSEGGSCFLNMRTFDPADIKTSRSGLWTAAIRNPLMGYHIDFYDMVSGELWHTYSPAQGQPYDKSRTGPSLLQWGVCPTSQEEYVLSADQRGFVQLIFMSTIERVQSILCHRSIHSPQCCVWVYGKDSYRMSRVPFEFSPDTKFDVTAMSLSDDNCFLATITSSRIVWIWNVQCAAEPYVVAVLHHEGKHCRIKEAKWCRNQHGSTFGVLLADSRRLSVWNTLLQEPLVIDTCLDGPLMGFQWLEQRYVLVAWSKTQLTTWHGYEHMDDNDGVIEDSARSQPSSYISDPRILDETTGSVTKDQFLLINQG